MGDTDGFGFLPITVLDVAYERTGKDRSESLTGYDFEKHNLPMMGGCQACGATVAAYNSCPSQTGYLMCLRSCIEDQGFKTVADFDQWDADRQADYKQWLDEQQQMDPPREDTYEDDQLPI